MRHKVCFLASHLGSGSDQLFHSLAENPRIQATSITVFNHPLVLQEVIERPHKCRNAAGIYLAHLLRNYEFGCPSLYGCRFIYMLRKPSEALSLIDMKEETAVRYYCYRLQRLCDMARHTPGAVVVRHEDLHDQEIYGLLKTYLNLQEPLRKVAMENCVQKRISRSNLEWAEDCYERHWYFLKQQNLVLAK